MDWLANLLSAIWDQYTVYQSWLFEKQMGVLVDALKLPLVLLYKLIIQLFGIMWDLWGDGIKAVAYNQAVQVAAAFESLPVPQALQDFPANWAAVPWSQMSFWLAPFEIGYGATVIVGGQALKFVLRWIPFVGAAFRVPSN
jgi:hypothetical protein